MRLLISCSLPFLLCLSAGADDTDTDAEADAIEILRVAPSEPSPSAGLGKRFFEAPGPDADEAALAIATARREDEEFMAYIAGASEEAGQFVIEAAEFDGGNTVCYDASSLEDLGTREFCLPTYTSSHEPIPGSFPVLRMGELYFIGLTDGRIANPEHLIRLNMWHKVIP